MRLLSIRNIAKHFSVAHTTVMRWKGRGAPVYDLDALKKWLLSSKAKTTPTQKQISKLFKRSEGQIAQWKKWGAPINDTKKLKKWVKARGIVLEKSISQRELALSVGINEGTLSEWKKLGAPIDSKKKLEKWMLINRRRSKNSGFRRTSQTPLYKIAEQAGITYSTLKRLQIEGAPISDSSALKRWLKIRKDGQPPTRKNTAQQLKISVDTLRRWERKGAPINDVNQCLSWKNNQINEIQIRKKRAQLKRMISRRVRARFAQFVNQGRLRKQQSVFDLVGCTQEQLLRWAPKIGPVDKR